jgi:hypothetical protein
MPAAANADEAREQLRTILLGAMKSRSVGRETLGDDEISLAILADLQPWLFDERKCVIEPLQKRIADPRPITPMEYYNFMVIALQFEPSIGICSVSLGNAPLPSSMSEIPLRAVWDV